MKRNALIVSIVVTVLTVAGVVGTIVGLKNTVGDLSVEMERSSVDAILAGAEVKDEEVVSVPILYYDQVMDECVDLYDTNLSVELKQRQFEWSSCGYYHKAFETGMTEAKLSDDYLPVAIGGSKQPNLGVTKENFERWFKVVDGKSQSFATTLKLRYDATTASFVYANENFYPLNELEVPAESVNADGNNHLFTLNLGVPVQVLADGNETFSITADDDTWVYLGDTLILDMGGIHAAMNGRLRIMETGEIYTALDDEDLAYSGVKVASGTGAIIRIFHADRDSNESVFRINFSNMLLNVTDATLAKNSVEGVDGTTVAYNPDDPSYVAPLGESLVYQPNRSRTILAAAVTQSLVIGVLSVVLIVTISAAFRYWRRDRNPE